MTFWLHHGTEMLEEHFIQKTPSENQQEMKNKKSSLDATPSKCTLPLL